MDHHNPALRRDCHFLLAGGLAVLAERIVITAQTFGPRDTAEFDNNRFRQSNTGRKRTSCNKEGNEIHHENTKMINEKLSHALIPKAGSRNKHPPSENHHRTAGPLCQAF